MNAQEIDAAVAKNVARDSNPAKAPKTFKAVGSATPQGMTVAEIVAALGGIKCASKKGAGDGTRIHVHYKAFGTPTPEAIAFAKRAADLGLPRDRYTGRVERLWKSAAGDMILTMFVELERDHLYRSLNLDKGTVFKIVVLGD